MSLTPGARLGPYEILAALGAGGMGEVYKARDTRLDRTVALKILPTSDPVRRQRFEREARAVAALNHPHICTLHDVGHQDGTDFLVMEYMEGQTLAERLKKGALPLDQALRYAIQIADALDAAHRHGIVHRDLKPSNVMLTKSGAKLLDFGIATIRPIRLTDGSVATKSELTLTAEGALIGTLHYMAPEQLEGREADARSDLFAFGAVLYEMLAGHRAFVGDSESKVIAAVLDSEPPPIIASQPLTPPVLEQVVKRCLAKDPDKRWQTATDLCNVLRWISEIGSHPAASAVPSLVPTRSKRERITWIVTASVLLLAMIGLAALISFRQPPTDTRVYRSSILLPPSANAVGAFALSPDGRHLAFMALQDRRRQLYVRSLDGLVARAVSDTDGWPFWSPDSRFLAFFHEGKLKKLPVSGGPPITLTAAYGYSLAGTWNQDNVIVFERGQNHRLHRVSASGGTSVPLTISDEGSLETQHHPEFLPDGRHFLYFSEDAAPGRVRGMYAASLDSNGRKLLLPDVSEARYAQGRLVFKLGETLMAQPFDVNRLELTGDPVRIAEQVAVFSVSVNGVLVYHGGGFLSPSQLVWFDRAGSHVGSLGDPAKYWDLELSPDGTQAAVNLPDSGEVGRIWLYDVGRGTRTRLTSDPADEFGAAWSPDGSRVIFGSLRGGPNLYWKASREASDEEALLSDGYGKHPASWSLDGRFLLYVRQSSESDLWVLPLFGDRKPFPFLRTRFNEHVGKFSPDGRWVAYGADESGRDEVYVAPFPEPRRKWLISTAGGMWPRWRRDGKEIFYLAPDNTLMAATVNTQDDNFRPEAVRPLFKINSLVSRYAYTAYSYDVSSNGQRFLVNTLSEDTSAPITLVVNWPALVKQ